MQRAKPRTRRCAIYTRKSSEEGLEQDFNSLHAQREACEAFIKSQAGEGWRLIKTAYDDRRRYFLLKPSAEFIA
jgi:DNA invertase Pin-like site-specific DNA recombinase